MDYIVDYVKEKRLHKSYIEEINYMQLYKQIILPYKLLGFNGKNQTRYYEYVEEVSCLEWVFKIPKTPKLKGKIIEKWQ